MLKLEATEQLTSKLHNHKAISNIIISKSQALLGFFDCSFYTPSQKTYKALKKLENT